MAEHIFPRRKMADAVEVVANGIGPSSRRRECRPESFTVVASSNLIVQRVALAGFLRNDSYVHGFQDNQ